MNIGDWPAKGWIAGRTPWIFILLLLPIILPIQQCLRRPPIQLPGTNFHSRSLPCDPSGIKLLTDTTGYDAGRGERVIEQQIFDHMLAAIQAARRVVVLDLFLWNAWQGAAPELHRNLSDELADTLIRRKQEIPDLDILVITDPINRVYGNEMPAPFSRMRDAGIAIVFTRLDAMRDSNLLYSPFARAYGRLLCRMPLLRDWLERPRWTDFLSGSATPLSTLQLARLLFFKANHRKVLIADTGSDAPALRLVVSSMNPANASSAHNNLGVQLEGPLAAHALNNELKILSWSLGDGGPDLTALRQRIQKLADDRPYESPIPAPVQCEWLTEQSIRGRIIRMLENTGPGDEVRIGVFYLSNRAIIDALCLAASNGADIRLLLDPNKDAFGRTKNGVPNRPVAAEILRRTRGLRCRIRWADTHGEQYHAKAMTISNPAQNKWQFIGGSANWTRRNLDGFNLEADLYVENLPSLNEQYAEQFDRTWNNTDGLQRSADYEKYADHGLSARWKNLLYRFLEMTGAGTF